MKGQLWKQGQSQRSGQGPSGMVLSIAMSIKWEAVCKGPSWGLLNKYAGMGSVFHECGSV